MPTPIGHALAGVAAAWIADLAPGDRAWRTATPSASWYERAGNGVTLACAFLATLPDIDLVWLPWFPRQHRTVTHSIGAVIVVGLTALIVRTVSDTSDTTSHHSHRIQRVRRVRPLRVALMCAAAYATHLLLDWLGVDNYPPYGLQALWPFSDAWFISNLNLFAQTARLRLLTPAVIRLNLIAIAQEAAILMPILVALWLVRVKALAGLPTELASRDHAPQ